MSIQSFPVLRIFCIASGFVLCLFLLRKPEVNKDQSLENDPLFADTRIEAEGVVIQKPELLPATDGIYVLWIRNKSQPNGDTKTLGALTLQPNLQIGDEVRIVTMSIRQGKFYQCILLAKK